MSASEAELDYWGEVELPQERGRLEVFGPNYGEIRGAHPIRDEWIGAGRSDFVDLADYR